MISFYRPEITLDDAANVVKALGTGWITRGKVCKQLEGELANKYQSKSVFVSDSNTACLELSLRYLGIHDGDEVITTPYTYSATADVIYNVGAKIVFCDIKEGTYEIDYDKIPELINENTKAIIAVDIGGVPCDYKRLVQIANSKKDIYRPSNVQQEKLGRIAIVSDAAHSINCEGCGMYADFTAFSFHAIKNITCGEGGALLINVNDENAYERISLLADHGQTGKYDFYKYDIALFGQNHIMTDYAASLALSQLSRVDAITLQRKEITRKYIDLIDKNCGEVLYNDLSSCHLLMVRLPENCNRDRVVEKMFGHGIGVNVHYIPLPMFTAYKNIGFNVNDYPNALKEFKKEITLPLYSKLTDAEIAVICEVFNDVVRSNVNG